MNPQTKREFERRMTLSERDHAEAKRRLAEHQAQLVCTQEETVLPAAETLTLAS